MRCLFANSRCSQCGQPLAVQERRECLAPQKIRDRKPRNRLPTSECPHFGGAVVPQETVLVYGCRTCRGVQGRETTVCVCELHGRCVLVSRGLVKDTIQRCSECADHPAAPSESSMATNQVSAPASGPPVFRRQS